MIPKQAHGDPFQATDTDATNPTATIAAVSGKTHYITDISVSSDKDGAIILVKDGTTVIWQDIVDANFYTHSFQTPLKGSKGALVSVEVDSTAAGKANIAGFTL